MWGHDRTRGWDLPGQTKTTTAKIRTTKKIVNSVHVNITHFHWVKKPERNHTKLHIGIQRETERQLTVSSKYRSKNKQKNTRIIIILQSTTKLKYITGNGCYYISLQILAALKKIKGCSIFFSCLQFFLFPLNASCSPTSDVRALKVYAL